MSSGDYRADLPPASVKKTAKEVRDAIESQYLVVANVRAFMPDRVRLDELRAANFDLVIVDEAHHIPAPTWKTLIEGFDGKETAFLFLTATPWYKGEHLLQKGLGLQKVYECTVADLVREGVIRKHEKVLTEPGSVDENDALRKIAAKVKEQLRAHDEIPGTRFRNKEAIVFARSRAKARDFVQIHYTTRVWMTPADKHACTYEIVHG